MTLESSKPEAPSLMFSSTRSRFRLAVPSPSMMFDAVLLIGFLSLSFWLLYLNLHYAAEHHLVWSGVDGAIPADQLQYLAWIRDAAQHLFASDQFVIRPTPHDYLEPLVAIGGGLVALGATPTVAFLTFQPVAVVVLFLAVRRYLRALLGPGQAHRAALLLALLSAVPGHTLLDSWIPFLTWGYMPAMFALAAMIGALLGYDRAARGQGPVWVPALLGMLVAWMHPWQGEELMLTVVGIELIRRLGRRRDVVASTNRRLSLPLATLFATALPLLYLLVLVRLDSTWRMAEVAGQVKDTPVTLLLGCLPLLAVAPLAYRRRPTSVLGLATRAWPIAAVVVCLLCYFGLGDNPEHALSGITIPLAALSVEVVAPLMHRSRRLAVEVWLLVLAATLPATASMMRWAATRSGYQVALVTRSEHRAIDYLAADPQRGAVLTSYWLGAIVPEATGRRTYDGDWAWSIPGWSERTTLVRSLFGDSQPTGGGPMSSGTATSFVLSTGARFVLVPCGGRGAVGLIRSVVVARRGFGCAAVLTIGERRAGGGALRRRS